MNMSAYFYNIHAGLDSQLLDNTCEISDTAEITALRDMTTNGEGWLLLRCDGFWPCYSYLAAWKDSHLPTI